MKLSTEIKNCQSMFDVRAILHDATGNLQAVSTTSWRGRFIQVVGYDGSIEIDALASRVIQIIKDKNFGFAEPERAIGKAIARQINQLYDASDRQLGNSNCFIRLLSLVREVFIGIFGSCFCPQQKHNLMMRDAWRHGDMFPCSTAFSYYTVEQHQARFGYLPPNLEELARFTNPFFLSAIDSGNLPVLLYKKSI